MHSTPWQKRASVFKYAKACQWTYVVLELAKCRFCSSTIEWKQKNNRWVPYDLRGSEHRCERVIDIKEPVIDPTHAVCAKCWKPIISSRSDVCIHLNPIYVDRREVPLLKAKFHASEREKARLEREQAHHVYHCVICDSLAVSAGDSVICTLDSSHVLPVAYYGQVVSS